jgi:hypothetical protein
LNNATTLRGALLEWSEAAITPAKLPYLRAVLLL